MSETVTPKSLREQIRLRPAIEADVPFIFNSWLRCYRHSRNTQGCENPVYFAQHHILIEGLCKRANILIACDEKNPAEIYGYICSETIEDVMVIHFMYIKEMYRKFGVGSFLAETAGFKKDAPIFYTHRTFNAQDLEKKFALVYNPYLAYSAYELGKLERKSE